MDVITLASVKRHELMRFYSKEDYFELLRWIAEGDFNAFNH